MLEKMKSFWSKNKTEIVDDGIVFISVAGITCVSYIIGRVSGYTKTIIPMAIYAEEHPDATFISVFDAVRDIKKT